MSSGVGRRRGSDPSLLVLISLASGARHGYAIWSDIGEFSGQQLGPGTLYGAIARLERDGLIEAVGEHQRRTPYRLTPVGSGYLAERVENLERLTTVAHGRIGS
jgi:DNA-binding PadR family transcriptional regulator